MTAGTNSGMTKRNRPLKFKALIKRFKHWIFKWLVSENLHRVYMHYRAENLQKFWFGKPSLPAPPLEKKYFEKIALSSSVVRRLDDYRAAAVVNGESSLPLDHCNGSIAIELAITPEYDYDGLSGPVIKLKLGDHETCIHDLPHERWYDIRLDVRGNADELIVNADAPIAITMPRGVNCNTKPKTEQYARHIVVLVLDAWTTSVVTRSHPFTGEATSTPNIDLFFSSGLRAMQGVSSGQWSLPAVGSLFTGLHVGRHRMTHPTRWQEFDLNRRTLPEYFQHNGYHTLCGSVVSRITPAFGHNRGFDRFLYHFAERYYSYQAYDPAVWTQEIISHLEIYHGDRTFSYFQFPDTHPSWDLAPDTRYFHLGRRGNTSVNIRKLMNSGTRENFDIPAQASQIYLLRLAELDRMFGCIFDYVERRLGDEAIFVVTADHGLRMPYLSEAHKNDEPFLTDIRVNIPLYMRGKGIPERVFDNLCSPNVDIPVMLLNLSGIKSDTDDLDGVNILNSEVKREVVVSEYVYAGIYEIAVRGYGHALFLKYKIDDVKYKILSSDPFYTGLYPLGIEEYLPESNLVKSNPDLAEKLFKAALSHISKAGLTGKTA